jgi:hypothetical protein
MALKKKILLDMKATPLTHPFSVDPENKEPATVR